MALVLRLQDVGDEETVISFAEWMQTVKTVSMHQGGGEMQLLQTHCMLLQLELMLY